MPYGIPKSRGGDSKENVGKMEKCVNDIHGTNKKTGKSYTKGEKIAICKAQLFGDKKSALEAYDRISSQYIDRAVRSGKARGVNEAFAQLESALSRSNYDINLLQKILEV
jgi:hypothetical protein